MSDYSAPGWLPGGHLQTIYPAKFIELPAVTLKRERWDTPDTDFIDVDFVEGLPGKPLLVLFHGLEGSSSSHYARSILKHIESLGWSGAIPHFRGCSGELNRAPRFYHSGDSGEIDWILHKMARHPLYRNASNFFAAGVSLGGNALLRWLGEFPEDSGFVDAACAISAPLDLAAGGAALSRGINMIYTRSFLQTLKPKCLQKLEQFPNLFDREKGRSKASVKRCRCALLVSIPIGKQRHWYCPTEVLKAVSGLDASSSDSCQKLVRWSRPLKIMLV
jgi:predicted alpha/beta-fold hydrolase